VPVHNLPKRGKGSHPEKIFSSQTQLA